MSIYLINNIIVPLEEEADFRREALRALRCKGSDLLKVDIYRKSVDARKKENIRLNYTIAATLKEGVTLRENAKYRLLMEDKPQFRPWMETMKHRPVIIGFDAGTSRVSAGHPGAGSTYGGARGRCRGLLAGAEAG